MWRLLMCELFCFNSDNPKQINNALECFYSHSERHPHGWGLANIKSDGYSIDKEPVKASESEHLREILSNPVVGKNVFAHIRLATMGKLTIPNCHPFTGRDNNGRFWVLMHNGTIFDYSKLDEYSQKQKGTTDSERILLFIVDKINDFETEKGELSTVEERFNLIKDIIIDMSLNNKLNIMISDGEMTYIHTNMKDSLHYIRKGNDLYVTSCPLNDAQNWKCVELNRIYGLMDGKIIFKSEDHGNEFIFTEKHEKIIQESLKSIDKDLYEKLMEEIENNSLSF